MVRYGLALVVCGIVYYGKVWFGVGGNDDGKRAPSLAFYSVTDRTLMWMIWRCLNTLCNLTVMSTLQCIGTDCLLTILQNSALLSHVCLSVVHVD